MPVPWPAPGVPYQACRPRRPVGPITVRVDLSLDDALACPDALSDHQAFDSRRHRSSGTVTARRGGGIDRLLVEVEIHADRFEMLDRAVQVDQKTGLADQHRKISCSRPRADHSFQPGRGAANIKVGRRPA